MQASSPSIFAHVLNSLDIALSLCIRYERSEAIRELASKTAQIKSYHGKLLSIRKTMTSLHERSTRLKRRALRFQSERQNELLAKETARELERERERKLVAKTDFGNSSN